ncbi:hypothetical protein SAMN02787144_101035 [Streptomyces atratus]|uniref:Uncharacterized protein n=1 Tax=Streptomyces atratus TaxID=1893 RepID=A0A1K2C402_STRAR|nr:hypothetical protein SAMN02787144_101035 [Streptomyces atratus]
MQALGGHSDVQFGRVRGEGLQDVEEMKPEDATRFAGHLQFALAPQTFPNGTVGCEQCSERRRM